MDDGAGAWGCKKGELLPLAFGALAAAARQRRQRVRARDDRWRSPTTLCSSFHGVPPIHPPLAALRQLWTSREQVQSAFLRGLARCRRAAK